METKENSEIQELDRLYRWRSEAKMVAYITWCLGWCYLTLVAMATCVWVFITIQMKRGYLSQDIQDLLPGLEPETENLYFGLGYTLLVALALMSVIKIWAADTLIFGITTIPKPHEIGKRCIIWRNANLLLLFFSSILILSKGYYDQWYVWLWIQFNLICIGLVWMHIVELKRESQKLTLTKEKYAATAENILKEPA